MQCHSLSSPKFRPIHGTSWPLHYWIQFCSNILRSFTKQVLLFKWHEMLGAGHLNWTDVICYHSKIVHGETDQSQKSEKSHVWWHTPLVPALETGQHGTCPQRDPASKACLESEGAAQPLTLISLNIWTVWVSRSNHSQAENFLP